MKRSARGVVERFEAGDRLEHRRDRKANSREGLGVEADVDHVEKGGRQASADRLI
jgi:hypothetical protein